MQCIRGCGGQMVPVCKRCEGDGATMEWINVKDDLPKWDDNWNKRTPERIKCLVVVRQYICFGYYMKKRHRKLERGESRNKVLNESKIGVWKVANFKSKDVTHWMPLPKPPETEDMENPITP